MITKPRVLMVLMGILACRSDSSIGPGDNGIGGKPAPEPANLVFPLRDVVAYTSHRYKETGELFLIDVRTLAKQRIISSGVAPECPVIASDGNGLAYLNDAGLVIVSPSGTKTVTARGCPLWSPDGQRVLSTTQSGTDGSTNLIVFSKSGAVLSVQAAHVVIGRAAWSPDGKQVGYTACPTSYFDCTGPSKLRIVPWDTLTSGAERVLADGFGDVSFSPTGAELAFECGGPGIYVCAIPAGGGAARQLGLIQASPYFWIPQGAPVLDWSPGANTIGYLCDGSICIVDAGTGSTTSPGSDS